jgi:hypothetical protein
MSETLFVVLAEEGEYSDRAVWVGGVYRTRAEAEAAIVERTAMRREYDNWHTAYLKRLWRDPRPLGYRHTDEEREAAKLGLGPEPPYEGAERAELVEVKVGEWDVSATSPY